MILSCCLTPGAGGPDTLEGLRIVMYYLHNTSICPLPESDADSEGKK